VTRVCRKCRAELGADDDVCRVCGETNPVVLPWYTLPLGALIVAILVLLLVDFGDIVRLFSSE